MSIRELRIESSVNAATNSTQERSYVIDYKVDLNSFMGPLMVREAVISALSGIGYNYFVYHPTQGGTYFEYDQNSYLQSVDVSSDQVDALTWNAVATYSPEIPSSSNPFTEPIRISIDGVELNPAMDKDARNVPVRNSAGDPFNPPLSRTKSRFTIQALRFEQHFPINIAFHMADTVNDRTFAGIFPSGTVKASFPSATHTTSVSGTIFEIRYRFDYSEEGWNASVLDQGMREYIPTGTQAGFHNILIDGQQVGSPVPLNGNGRVSLSTGTPVFREFQPYRTANFDIFNISSLPGVIV